MGGELLIVGLVGAGAYATLRYLDSKPATAGAGDPCANALTAEGRLACKLLPKVWDVVRIITGKVGEVLDDITPGRLDEIGYVATQYTCTKDGRPGHTYVKQGYEFLTPKSINWPMLTKCVRDDLAPPPPPGTEDPRVGFVGVIPDPGDGPIRDHRS